MARPGAARTASNLALGGRNPRAWFAIPRWTMGRLEATDRAGICLRPLVDPRQLLLLCHHRTARCAPGLWSFGSGCVPMRAGPVKACGVRSEEHTSELQSLRHL